MLHIRYWIFRTEVEICAAPYGEEWYIRTLTYLFNVRLAFDVGRVFNTYEDAALFFLDWRKQTKNPFYYFVDWRDIRKSMFNNLMGIKE